MVSSYLICDMCGGFGPPASFVSHNGLRFCYQCWYREQGGDDSSPAPPESDAAALVEPASDPLAPPDQSRSSS